MKDTNQFELPGGDNECKVYYSENKVIREFFPGFGLSARLAIEIIGLETLENFGVVKTKVLNNNDDSLILEHKLLPFALPSIWTVGHLIDSLKLTMELSNNLKKFGFGLKDYLPENIVFDGVNPFFVDFASITSIPKIPETDWIITESEGKNYMKYLFKKQMLPFFLIPIFSAYLRSQNDMRNLLRSNYCNSGKTVPSYRDLKLFTISKKNFSLKIRILLFLFLFGKFKELKINFKLVYWILKFLEKKSSLPNSAYSQYYLDKAEDSDFNQGKSWNKKQTNLDSLVSRYRPCSLLDIGSNTGWFSILAAVKGAQVIAFDQDISSIYNLYVQSKKMKLNISSYVLSFEDLISELELELEFEIQIDKDPRRLPNTRFSSDIVLALGLIHHLCLGSGYAIPSIMKVLAAVTNKCLVVEFVELEDEKILSEPGFFKNFSKSKNEYSLNSVVQESKKYFSRYEILESHPNSRTLVTFFKN